jgi:hypothetical protein
MNRFITIPLIVILLSSCVKEKEYSRTNIVRLANPTDKHLRYYFEADFGIDTLISKGYDTAEYSFTEKKTVKSRWVNPDRIFNAELVYREELYDLDDTLSFVYTIDSNMTQKEYNYMEYTNVRTKGSGKNDVVIVTELVYNDSLQAFLQKDYTMLEKFKEYYQK